MSHSTELAVTIRNVAHEEIGCALSAAFPSVSTFTASLKEPEEELLEPSPTIASRSLLPDPSSLSFAWTTPTASLPVPVTFENVYPVVVGDGAAPFSEATIGAAVVVIGAEVDASAAVVAAGATVASALVAIVAVVTAGAAVVAAGAAVAATGDAVVTTGAAVVTAGAAVVTAGAAVVAAGAVVAAAFEAVAVTSTWKHVE